MSRTFMYRVILFGLVVLLGLCAVIPPVGAANPGDWFNHQVDFKTEYLIVPTPKNFSGGTLAYTRVSISPWALDGKGMTVSVVTAQKQGDGNSYVLDLVFNPQKYGFPANTTSRLHDHEQVHYDLAALWLREYLNKAKGQPRQRQIDLWNEMLKHSIQGLDNAYESSTGTNIDSPVQDKWVKEIATLKGQAAGGFSDLEQWAVQNGYLNKPAIRRSSATHK